MCDKQPKGLCVYRHFFTIETQFCASCPLLTKTQIHPKALAALGTHEMTAAPTKGRLVMYVLEEGAQGSGLAHT